MKSIPPDKRKKFLEVIVSLALNSMIIFSVIYFPKVKEIFQNISEGKDAFTPEREYWSAAYSTERQPSNPSLCKRLKSETAAIARFPTHVGRNWAKDITSECLGSLGLSLEDGGGVVVIDSIGSIEEEMTYEFVNYLEKDGFYLITVNFYEGSSGVLISATTGMRQQVPNVHPSHSPDGRKLLFTNIDLESPYKANILKSWNDESNSIEIWNIEQHGKAVKKFSLNPVEWGAESEKWIDNDTVEFYKVVLSEKPGHASHKKIGKSCVKRFQDEWKLIEGDSEQLPEACAKSPP